MTTTINAVAGTGLVQTSDASGIIKLQSAGVTTNALAWCNFDGTTGTRRASYNVTSVTRNATGDYTLTFTNAMADINYAFLASVSVDSGGTNPIVVVDSLPGLPVTPTTTTTRMIVVTRSTGAAIDPTYVQVAVFGN